MQSSLTQIYAGNALGVYPRFPDFVIKFQF